MVSYLLYENDTLIKSTFEDYKFLWQGYFSESHIEGNIVRFITNYLKDKNVYSLFFQSDGRIHSSMIYKTLYENKLLPLQKKIIIVTLSQISEDPQVNYFYLYSPLDDNFFTNGVNFYFPENTLPSWEERSSAIVWRGACSGDNGGDMDSVRCRAVEMLQNYPNTDVKLTMSGWNGKNIPPHFLGDYVNYTEFFKFKIFLIIDGNCIASNHMWGFSTGCVPLMITQAKCWFSKFLIPFVNYIPVRYDLGDLIEKIEWVKNNDAEAKKIAENALQFSKDYFNSEFQKKYIMEEIDKICEKL